MKIELYDERMVSEHFICAMAYGDTTGIDDSDEKMQYKICLHSRILYTYSMNTPIESLRYLTDLARSKYGELVTLEFHAPKDGGMVSKVIY